MKTYEVKLTLTVSASEDMERALIERLLRQRLSLQGYLPLFVTSFLVDSCLPSSLERDT